MPKYIILLLKNSLKTYDRIVLPHPTEVSHMGQREAILITPSLMSPRCHTCNNAGPSFDIYSLLNVPQAQAKQGLGEGAKSVAGGGGWLSHQVQWSASGKVLLKSL
jgi:hypothetical protein